CGCVRRIWDRLVDDRSRRTVDVAERYADSRATVEELTEAWETASEVPPEVEQLSRPPYPTVTEAAELSLLAAQAAIHAAAPADFAAISDEVEYSADRAAFAAAYVATEGSYPAGPQVDLLAAQDAYAAWRAARMDEEGNQCRLLRDLF